MNSSEIRSKERFLGFSIKSLSFEQDVLSYEIIRILNRLERPEKLKNLVLYLDNTEDIETKILAIFETLI